MIGSVEVRSGDLVLGGDEGLVVATEEEVMAVIDAAEAIQLGGEAPLCGDSGRFFIVWLHRL
jgi:regulator of RNase E activity RraA